MYWLPLLDVKGSLPVRSVYATVSPGVVARLYNTLCVLSGGCGWEGNMSSSNGSACFSLLGLVLLKPCCYCSMWPCAVAGGSCRCLLTVSEVKPGHVVK